MSRNTAIIIPARLNSQRLPNKPLALLGEFPLIWHTWQKALKVLDSSDVYITTDSDKIYNLMTQEYQANCIMTPESCPSGSDRVYQASQQLSNQYQYIINLQGDEPLMPVSMITGVIDKLHNIKYADITSASTNFQNADSYNQVSNVKVVVNSQEQAVYFSRQPIANAQLHLGIYGYKRDALEKFANLPKSSLEQAENLEQLRAFDSDLRIFIYNEKSSDMHFGIDTFEDLELARKILLS